MSRTVYKTEAELMETAQIRIENTRNQPIIKENMNRLGYGEEKLKKGEDYLAAAQSAYNFKKQEDFETKETSTKFNDLKESIGTQYKEHREIAKVVFKNTPNVLFKLGVNGKLSENYVKWNETINTFYSVSSADKTIQDALAAMAVTPEQVNKQKIDLVEMEKEHIDYVREKGESQEATAQKNKSFEDLKKWNSEFKAVAKIALKEHIQLLEALRIKA